MDRDRTLLAALARTRYLTTTLIALLVFHGSRRVANRRARKLLDLGLIRCWVTALDRDNIYGLTSAGRRLLESSGEDVPNTIQCPRQLDAQWPHELAINAFRVRLAIELQRHGSGIAWWHSNRELRTSGRRTMIPDALFAVDWSDGAQQTYALEVEYHTRAPQSFLKKIARYAAAAHESSLHGGPIPIVLVVGQCARRLESYRAAATRFAPPMTVAFANLAEIERSGPTAVIWKTPVDSELLSLRRLPSCGYRNYTLGPEMLGETRARFAPAEHNSELQHP